MSFANAFTLKTAMVLSLVLSPVLFAGTAWGEGGGGNGRGYNGPSLQSQSIPIQIDRGVRASNLWQAVHICTVEGDPKAGLVSVAERIVQQLTKLPYSEFKFPKRFGENEKFVADLRSKTVKFRAERYNLNGGDVIRISSMPFDEGIAISGANLLGNNSKVFEINLKIPGELPKIAFDSAVDVDRYDDLGRLIETDLMLQGIKIILPPEYGPKVRLTNGATDHPTRVTLNLIEYVECLQAEIQKHAE